MDARKDSIRKTLKKFNWTCVNTFKVEIISNTEKSYNKLLPEFELTYFNGFNKNL